MAGYDDCSGKFYNFGGSTVLHIFVGFSLSHSPKPPLHRHSTANVCYLQPPSSVNTVRGWVHTACMSCLSLSLQWQNLQKQLLVRDICPEEGLRRITRSSRRSALLSSKISTWALARIYQLPKFFTASLPIHPSLETMICCWCSQRIRIRCSLLLKISTDDDDDDFDDDDANASSVIVIQAINTRLDIFLPPGWFYPDDGVLLSDLVNELSIANDEPL